MGEDMLMTLIRLLESQEGIKIEYEIKEVDSDSRAFSTSDKSA